MISLRSGGKRGVMERRQNLRNSRPVAVGIAVCRVLASAFEVRDDGRPKAGGEDCGDEKGSAEDEGHAAVASACGASGL